MLQWLKSLVSEEKLSSEDVRMGTAWTAALTGMRAFLPGFCPYSEYVKAHGVETRVFYGTRKDN